jgi:hypothetical protein
MQGKLVLFKDTQIHNVQFAGIHSACFTAAGFDHHRVSPVTGFHPSPGFTRHRVSPVTGFHPALFTFAGFHPALFTFKHSVLGNGVYFVSTAAQLNANIAG